MNLNNSAILILANTYALDSGTSSVRSTKLSESFKHYFNKVHVLTNKANYWPEGINLIELKVDSIRESVRRQRNGKILDEEQKQKPWAKTAIKALKSFPSNLILSEVHLGYITKALNILPGIIKKENITHIFSSSPPYGDHYIARILKKQMPHLTWIADFRDLHVEPVYQDVFMPKFQQRIEKKVLKRADLVTTVSEGLVKHLQKYERPSYAVLRGIEERAACKQYDKFTISYTGSLFQEYRDSRPLFATLRELLHQKKISPEDLQLIYAGKDGEVYGEWVKAYELQDFFIDIGVQSRETAQGIQDRSHINLLLTSADPEWQGVLTGKLFEYIESGNATLCIIKGVRDREMESLFERFNAGAVVYDPALEKDNMADFILEKYNEWKATGKVRRQVDFEEIKRNHSWDSRVEFMLTKLEQEALVEAD